jgi:type IV pilus assembly protein PilF
MIDSVQEQPLQAPQANRLAVLHTQLGIGYLREGRNELAFRKLSKALEAQSDYSGAHNAIALLYERLGQDERARKHFRAAIEYAPQDSSARNNYGSFLCRRGFVDEAIEQFEAAVANPLYEAPGNALTNAGLCLYRSEQTVGAETYLRRALRQNPRQVSALLTMSEIAASSGRELSARGYLERFLTNGKHNSQSLWLGVRIERKLGDLNAASSYALLLKANYPDARETRLLLESESQ